VAQGIGVDQGLDGARHGATVAGAAKVSCLRAITRAL